MNKNIIKEIQKLTEEIKKEYHYDERVIRDDVFNILQKNSDCMVLYYSMEDEATEDGCDGCHVIRTVKGKQKQLVFINTSNTRERQAFSVAHELGHIWKVDEKVKQKFDDCEIEVEEVINRFAAELLMPEDIFINEAKKQLAIVSENISGKIMIKVSDFIKVIVYLMNYFFAPYKAIVIRLHEVDIIDEVVVNKLLEYKESQYVNSAIQEGQYTRLGIKTKNCSVAYLSKKIEEIEQKNIFSENKIKEIKEKFKLVGTVENKGIDESLSINNP